MRRGEGREMRKAKEAEALPCGHQAVVPCVSRVTVVYGEGGLKGAGSASGRHFIQNVCSLIKVMTIL